MILDNLIEIRCLTFSILQSEGFAESQLQVTCEWPYVPSNENGDLWDNEHVANLLCMLRAIQLAEEDQNSIYRIIYSWRKVSRMW
jgi:hypothetical protein